MEGGRTGEGRGKKWGWMGEGVGIVRIIGELKMMRLWQKCN